MSIIEKIIGSPDAFPIEQRLLNGSCGITMVFSLVILINNIILGLDIYLNLIIGLASIFFLFLYYCSRFRGQYLFPMWGTMLFFIAAFPLAWFLNSGLFGSTIYIAFVILALILVIARGKPRIIISTLFITEIILVIIAEYYHPEIVVLYENRAMQFTDIVINLAFSLIMLTVLIMLVMKKYEEEKRKANESNMLKSFFIANISHEIRTPMNSILGFSALLKDRSLSDEEKEHNIDIIQKSGMHLLELIDDILDLSRIEAGQVIIHRRPFSPDALLVELHDIFKLQISKNRSGIELFWDRGDGNYPETISADETRIRQVLMNLINNAVKFTESGSIHFGCRVVTPGRIQFHVTDTGIGISRENIPKIFLQFKQVDDSHTRKYGGAGLGLTISEKLINLMDGTIWLESDLGEGTAFYFDIPYEEAVPDGSVDMKSVADKKAGKGPRNWKNRTVLVVEDDEQSYRYLERVMQRYGINVIRTDNGLEAVELCRNNPAIDCILMDIQLPMVSGNEATRMIREIRKDVPIIAQSGNAYDTDRMASIEAGCNEFLSKPVLPDKLLEVLDRYL